MWPVNSGSTIQAETILILNPTFLFATVLYTYSHEHEQSGIRGLKTNFTDAPIPAKAPPMPRIKELLGTDSELSQIIFRSHTNSAAQISKIKI